MVLSLQRGPVHYLTIYLRRAHACTLMSALGVKVLLTFVMVGYQGSDGKEPTSGHQGHKGFSGPRCGLSVDYDPF